MPGTHRKKEQWISILIFCHVAFTILSLVPKLSIIPDHHPRWNRIKNRIKFIEFPRGIFILNLQDYKMEKC